MAEHFLPKEEVKRPTKPTLPQGDAANIKDLPPDPVAKVSDEYKPTSKFFGVSWRKKNRPSKLKCWLARVNCVNYGWFDNQKDAAAKVDQILAELGIHPRYRNLTATPEDLKTMKRRGGAQSFKWKIPVGQTKLPHELRRERDAARQPRPTRHVGRPAKFKTDASKAVYTLKNVDQPSRGRPRIRIGRKKTKRAKLKGPGKKPKVKSEIQVKREILSSGRPRLPGGAHQRAMLPDPPVIIPRKRRRIAPGGGHDESEDPNDTTLENPDPQPANSQSDRKRKCVDGEEDPRPRRRLFGSRKAFADPAIMEPGNDANTNDLDYLPDQAPAPAPTTKRRRQITQVSTRYWGVRHDPREHKKDAPWKAVYGRNLLGWTSTEDEAARLVDVKLDSLDIDPRFRNLTGSQLARDIMLHEAKNPRSKNAKRWRRTLAEKQSQEELENTMPEVPEADYASVASSYKSGDEGRWASSYSREGGEPVDSTSYFNPSRTEAVAWLDKLDRGPSPSPLTPNAMGEQTDTPRSRYNPRENYFEASDIQQPENPGQILLRAENQHQDQDWQRQYSDPQEEEQPEPWVSAVGQLLQWKREGHLTGRDYIGGIRMLDGRYGQVIAISSKGLLEMGDLETFKSQILECVGGDSAEIM